MRRQVEMQLGPPASVATSRPGREGGDGRRPAGGPTHSLWGVCAKVCVCVDGGNSRMTIVLS